MSAKIQNSTKWWLILGITAAAGILHYGGEQNSHVFHMIHREIFFLPIILAGFWFGVVRGLAVSGIISLIYASYFFLRPDSHMNVDAIGLQVIMFVLVACVLGYLSDRRKKQQNALMKAYGLSVLGRSAAIIGFEMKDLWRSLLRLSESLKTGNREEMLEQFQHELERMGKMVDVITSFAPEEKTNTISQDINELLETQTKEYMAMAKKKKMNLLIEFDDAGCPAVTNPEELIRIVKRFVQNALDYSEPGQTVSLSTKRGGKSCRILVKDQGPGIRKEHLPSMFSPFFTTWKEGRGLTMASSRKVLRTLGGDITVESVWGEGTVFTIHVPCDKEMAEIRFQALNKSGSKGV